MEKLGHALQNFCRLQPSKFTGGRPADHSSTKLACTYEAQTCQNGAPKNQKLALPSLQSDVFIATRQELSELDTEKPGVTIPGPRAKSFRAAGTPAPMQNAMQHAPR